MFRVTSKMFFVLVGFFFCFIALALNNFNHFSWKLKISMCFIYFKDRYYTLILVIIILMGNKRHQTLSKFLSLLMLLAPVYWCVFCVFSISIVLLWFGELYICLLLTDLFCQNVYNTSYTT